MGGCNDKDYCWREAEHPLQRILLELQISWLVKIAVILQLENLMCLAEIIHTVSLCVSETPRPFPRDVLCGFTVCRRFVCHYAPSPAPTALFSPALFENVPGTAE